jgi:mono/diheme cytochrome c family protein
VTSGGLQRAGALGALALAACTPAPFVGDPLATQRGGSGTFAGLAQSVFVPRCASSSCHGGNPPAVFPSLDAATGWAALVNVPSQQAVMMLVEPGAPDQSWLVVRLKGEGGRPYMPLGDAQLSASEIAAVESWIANGAPP